MEIGQKTRLRNLNKNNMRKITIAFDVDGTLRCNKDSYEIGNAIHANPNEDIRALLITLSKFKNVECHIWSGGGQDYALDIRRLFLLQNYVKEVNCHWKGAGFKPDIAIDDIHDCILGGVNLIVKQK